MNTAYILMNLSETMDIIQIFPFSIFRNYLTEWTRLYTHFIINDVAKLEGIEHFNIMRMLHVKFFYNTYLEDLTNNLSKISNVEISS